MKTFIKFEIILIFIFGLATVIITANALQSILVGALGIGTVLVVSTLLTKMYSEHE